MTTQKALIPSFSLKGGRAVIQDDGIEYYSEDILALGRFYGDHGADALLIHDWSDTDQEHENHILWIKHLARDLDIPIITGGHVNRLEDIKKYLYAGAAAVYLDISQEEEMDLVKEGADRFGNEKIYARMTDLKDLVRGPEAVQLGASLFYIDIPYLEPEQMEVLGRVDTPFLLFCDEDTPEAITSCLKLRSARGVVLTVPEKREGDCMAMKQQLKARGIPMDTFEPELQWKDFKLNSDGMMPVIVQDYKSSEVLMMAYMNEQAYMDTLTTGTMHYYSRSRQCQWLKGETSGHVQFVKSLKLDCDMDTILAKVKQIGPACHTGSHSCFFNVLAEKKHKNTNPLKVFEDVFDIILDRKEHPKEGSYTNYLFDKGLDKILKKLGEEATEIVIASKNPEPEEIKYEISDFLYHMMVLMAEKGITWEEITQELANR